MFNLRPLCKSLGCHELLNIFTMNQMNPEPDDAKLSALLRESRSSPTLPPRFREGVWKRIKRSEASLAPGSARNWLDIFAGYLLRPRFALAAAAAMIVAGSAFGIYNGNQLAHQDAQARYVDSVAPNSLR